MVLISLRPLHALRFSSQPLYENEMWKQKATQLDQCRPTIPSPTSNHHCTGSRLITKKRSPKRTKHPSRMTPIIIVTTPVREQRTSTQRNPPHTKSTPLTSPNPNQPSTDCRNSKARLHYQCHHLRQVRIARGSNLDPSTEERARALLGIGRKKVGWE